MAAQTSNKTPTKTEQSIGTLMPFSMFYDPIFGFQMNRWQEYMQSAAEIVQEQEKRQIVCKTTANPYARNHHHRRRDAYRR